MKHLKIIGLAVVAASALMALMGASSAFAGTTSLCKVSTEPCPAGSQYPAGTKLKGSTPAGEPALLTTSKAIGTVECASTVEGETSEETAVGLKGKVTALTWANCVLNGKACTVESVNLKNGVGTATPYAARLTTEATAGAGNGGLYVTASTTGNPGAKVVCGEVINCTYTTAEAKLSAFGGAALTAFAKATEVALTGTGGKCPAAKWDAKYVISLPTTAVFLST
jgi:hypothetical protein